jgi:hypothetical protein
MKETIVDDNTVPLLQAMLRATPEERKSFWQGLEDYCEANGLEKQFYCPYVPLQMTTAQPTPNTSFKTRYGTIHNGN